MIIKKKRVTAEDKTGKSKLVKISKSGPGFSEETATYEKTKSYSDKKDDNRKIIGQSVALGGAGIGTGLLVSRGLQKKAKKETEEYIDNLTSRAEKNRKAINKQSSSEIDNINNHMKEYKKKGNLRHILDGERTNGSRQKIADRDIEKIKSNNKSAISEINEKLSGDIKIAKNDLITKKLKAKKTGKKIALGATIVSAGLGTARYLRNKNNNNKEEGYSKNRQYEQPVMNQKKEKRKEKRQATALAIGAGATKMGNEFSKNIKALYSND